MILPIKYHPEAAKEYRSAVEWYERVSLDVAKDFSRELRKAARRAQAKP